MVPKKKAVYKPPASEAKEPEKKQRPRQTYGLEKLYPDWVARATQFELDRYAFAWRIPITEGTPLRPFLFRKIAEELAPEYFEWHAWTNKIIHACCSYKFIALAGCGSSSKTHNMAGWAATWWLCAPNESSVIFCSTTAKALRKRGWANVQQFYAGIPGKRIGNFVDSRMTWQIETGNDRNAIVGIAVEEGATHRVADNIKGIHTKRQMVIIDEATAVPAAIFDACSNLHSYPDEFIMVMIGNPRSRLDEFGKFMEPAGGWNSVSVETEEWETRPQLDGQNGICIRFDVEKSPNIVSPLPGGMLVSAHLPTKERLESSKRRPDYVNDPLYWSNERGFPPPEGLSKAVFSEASLLSTDAYGRHRFTGNNFQIIAALDPARTGGDRPALRFAALGEIEDGGMGIELLPPIILSMDATSKNPVDYQLVEKVRRECEHVIYRGVKTSCSPSNFGLDASGSGASFADTVQRMWSSSIIRIGFGEAASGDSVSHEDIRPANTVYKNRRAEMYFRARGAVDSGQLKGFDQETAKEICTVNFDDSRSLIILVSKEEYRKHHSNSPDLSDTVAMIVEVARRKGFKLRASGQTLIRSESFDKLVLASRSIYSTSDHSIPEEMVDDYEDDFEQMV